jgi:hypothetical protein
MDLGILAVLILSVFVAIALCIAAAADTVQHKGNDFRGR